MISQRFNATTSDISFGVRGSQTPSAQTILALIYPIGSGETSQGTILSRTPGTVVDPFFFVDHNAGAPRLAFTTNSSGSGAERPLVWSADNTITYGAWQHVAMTWDGGIAVANIHDYIGLRGSPLAETAYGFTADGSGTATYGGANELHIGSKTGQSSTFNGDIAYVAQWRRVLNLAELKKAQRFGPLAVLGGLILFWDGQRDLGPYAMTPTAVIALTAGFTIPIQFRPAPKRTIYGTAAAAGVFIKLVGDNFRLAGGGGLAG